jgi:hypothetical protein
MIRGRSLVALLLTATACPSPSRSVEAPSAASATTPAVASERAAAPAVPEPRPPRLVDVDAVGVPFGVDAASILANPPATYDRRWVTGVEGQLFLAMTKAGYRGAELVDHEVTPVRDGVSVHFRLRPGSHLRLRAVRLEGRVAAPERRLLSSIMIRPSAPLLPGHIERDASAMEKELKRKGWLKPSVTGRTEDNGDGTVDVVFAIVEGPSYRLGRMTIAGPGKYAHHRYLKALSLFPPGQTFEWERVHDVVDEMESVHWLEERRHRHVRSSWTVDDQRHVVNVVLEVE